MKHRSLQRFTARSVVGLLLMASLFTTSAPALARSTVGLPDAGAATPALAVSTAGTPAAVERPTPVPAYPADVIPEKPDRADTIFSYFKMQNPIAQPGETVTMDLVLQPMSTVNSFEVLLSTRGSAQIVGPSSIALQGTKAGTAISTPVQLTLSGMGKGEIDARIVAKTAAGAIAAQATPLLWFAADDEVLFGPDYYGLELGHAKRQLDAGKINQRDYHETLKRLGHQGVADAGSATSNAPTVSTTTTSTGAVSADGTTPTTGATPTVSGTQCLDQGGTATGDQATVQGDIRFSMTTEYASAGASFPVPFAKVEVWDDDDWTDDPEFGDDDLLGTTTTDVNGHFSFTFANDTAAPENGADVYIIAYAQTDTEHVEAGGVVQGQIYTLVSSNCTDVQNGQAVDRSITTENPIDYTNHSAFSVLSGANVAHRYMQQQHSYAMPNLTINYPSWNGGSYYDGALNIDKNDRFDWDVITHEYGHFVTDQFNIDDDPGGTHYINAHASETMTKMEAIRLAWAEGWPTYFGTVLQKTMTGPYDPMYKYGDVRYYDGERSNGALDYDLEAQSPWNSLGEDSELAVQRIMYDLYDSGESGGDTDNVSYSEGALWNAATSVHAHTLSDFYQSLISGKSESEKAKIDAVFASHNVTPKVTALANTQVDDTSIPTFTWVANGAPRVPYQSGQPYKGEYYNNSFSVKFFDQNWNLILQTPETVMDHYIVFYGDPIGDTTYDPYYVPTYTPTQQEWDTLMHAGATKIYWQPVGKAVPYDQTTGALLYGYETGPYAADPGSMDPLSSITVSASTASLNVGGTVQMSATGHYGSATKDLTYAGPTNFYSSNDAVATVSPTGVVTAKAPGTAQIYAQYGGLESNHYTISVSAPVTSLTISPASPTLSVNSGVQMALTAHYSGYPDADVTTGANWTSSNQTVATVGSNTGYVTTKSTQGTSTITATYGGASTNTTVTVSALSVTPTSATVTAGYTTQLTAKYGGSDVTGSLSTTWTSSNTNIATVSGGTVTGKAQGTVTVTATYAGYSASSTITVNPPAVTAVSVTPASVSLAAGQTKQLTATATFSNGTTQDVTASASTSWSSGNTNIATVSSTGLVTAKAQGSITIWASYGGQLGSSSFTVTAPVLTGVSVSPTSASPAAGQTQQMTATATYSDGSTQNVTSSASTSWQSSNTSVATVSTTGLVTAKAAGTTTISASYGGYSASSMFTVQAAAITGLSISPSSTSTNAGYVVSLWATATYSDNTSKDVSNLATWTSSNTSIATVNTVGDVTTHMAGTVTITATYSGKSATSTITVNAPVVSGLSVSPSSASLGIGGGQQLSATATYSNGTTGTVTNSASWSTSNSLVATVSAAGYVTAQGTGTATITGSYSGYSSSATITVTCTTGSSFNCPYTLSGSTTSSVSTGVYVWYKYQVSAGTPYTVNLVANSGDPDLAVYDLNQSLVGSSSAGGSDYVSFTASYSGYYYIRVYGYSAANYTLSVTTGGGCSAGSSFDCPITLSGSTSGSVSQGQYVYYRYYASSGTTYTANLTANSGDPDLAIFDPNRNQIASSSAGGSDSASFTANTTGYYFVRVYGYSAASYSLSVSAGGGTPPPCTSGSDFSCAITFSASVSGSVTQGQNKYYKFMAYAGTGYTVRLTANSGDPDLSVYNPSQSLVGSSSAVGSDTVTFTATTTGYYYVKVYGYSAANYTVSY